MVHKRCTRLRSGARDCGVVHDGTRVDVPTARQREVPQQLRKLVSGAREWCTRVVRVEHGGARKVHEIGGKPVPNGTKSAVSWLVGQVLLCTWVARSWVCTWIARPWVCTCIARS